MIDPVDCPACYGGERVANPSWRNDPQEVVTHRCPLCKGDGSVSEAVAEAWLAENYEPPEISYDDQLWRACDRERDDNLERELF